MEKSKMMRVDTDTHRIIKTEAAKRGITITELLRLLIQKFIGND